MNSVESVATFLLTIPSRERVEAWLCEEDISVPQLEKVKEHSLWTSAQPRVVQVSLLTFALPAGVVYNTDLDQAALCLPNGREANAFELIAFVYATQEQKPIIATGETFQLDEHDEHRYALMVTPHHSFSWQSGDVGWPTHTQGVPLSFLFVRPYVRV